MLPRDVRSLDDDVSSIIEDLQGALQTYSGASYFTDLPVLPCTEAPAHLQQRAELVCRLTMYQMCVSPCPGADSKNEAIALNQYLLQHLKGSDMKTSSAACPHSSSSSSSSSTVNPRDFTSMSRCVQCVWCWSQQVAALVR